MANRALNRISCISEGLCARLESLSVTTAGEFLSASVYTRCSQLDLTVDDCRSLQRQVSSIIFPLALPASGEERSNPATSPPCRPSRLTTARVLVDGNSTDASDLTPCSQILPTTIHRLDGLLRGGLRKKSVIEICGATGSPPPCSLVYLPIP